MNQNNDALNDRLSRYREITISVTGRKSGRTISNPVWFVFENGKLYLLPVHGTQTQWYKNVLKKPSIRVDACGTDAAITLTRVSDEKQVSLVVEMFRKKYGPADVKKYYSNFDAAAVGEIH